MADNLQVRTASGATTSVRTTETGGVHTPVHKAELRVVGEDVSPDNPVPMTSAALGAAADPEATGDGSVIGLLKRLRTLFSGVLATARPPVTLTEVAGSPFALTPSWQKVTTTTTADKALAIWPLADASAYDIEVAYVPAGSAAPTKPRGRPILAGEDFPGGMPLGDIYLKSATSQSAGVEKGV
ncbi:hypothetical protein [Mongoliimonas terrestris]|uniref:hypothetical protein n=1 Tax=Mongoliimonas terrestris TaxID=1709001 RepID=UPI0009497C2B|nr:hypothetical protein [Mongoliimonas terrestris]